MSSVIVRAREFLSAGVNYGVIKRTFVYIASGSASALVSFLLLPILTRYLSPYDYGVVETFTTLSTCLTGVVLVGGNTILAKEYFDVEPESRANLVGTAIALVTIGTGICGFLILCLDITFFSVVSSVMKVGRGVVVVAIVASGLNAIITLFTTLLQVEKRATTYAVYVNTKSLVDIGISLLLIVGCGWQWMGRIVGMSVGAGLYAFVAWAAFRRRNVRINFCLSSLRHFFALGLPMVGAHVSVWVYGMFDRLLINNLFDVGATGIYSVGYRFATVVNMVEAAFSIAWMPFFFETLKLDTTEAKVRIVRFTYLYIAALLLLAIIFGYTARWILPWMVAPQFAESGNFVIVLSLGFWCSGAWKMFNGYLIVKGKTKLYGYITAGAAVLHVLSTWFLLKHFGLIGAAWATFATFAVATIVTACIAARLYPMPWIPQQRPMFGRSN